MSETVFFAKGTDPLMIAAMRKAQDTFKYFWRELSWEYRRIVPGLEVACVKVAFSQQQDGGGEPTVEHMWINDIDYDGELIHGTLVNDPNELTNIQAGDAVSIPLAQLSDWLFAIGGQAYGGFTIDAMRQGMDATQRAAHDEAWGLHFGEPGGVLLVNGQETQPENLEEHPMSRNMKESLEDFLKGNPAELTGTDANGNTMLHREAIAGNKTSVAVLLQAGADATVRNHAGKTALDYARHTGWPHLLPLLEGAAG